MSTKQDSSSKVIVLKPRDKRAGPEQAGGAPQKKAPGGILYEETLAAPVWVRLGVYGFFAVLIVFFLIYPVLNPEANDLLHLLLCLSFAVIAWVLHIFLVLSITMTSRGVQFGFYLFSQKVAYTDIIECRVYRYKLSDTLGWGIRKGPDGSTVYNVPGDQQISVRLVVLEDEKRKEFVFSARRPEVICKIIQSQAARDPRSVSASQAEGSKGRGLLSNDY